MRWMEKMPVCGDIIRTKVQFYHHYGIFVSEQEVIQFGLPDDPFRPAEEIKVLTSDIQGGNNAGIRTCWYNPNGDPNKSDLQIDYEITHLGQVLDIL